MSKYVNNLKDYLEELIQKDEDIKFRVFHQGYYATDVYYEYGEKQIGKHKEPYIQIFGHIADEPEVSELTPKMYENWFRKPKIDELRHDEFEGYHYWFSVDNGIVIGYISSDDFNEMVNLVGKEPSEWGNEEE